MITLSIFLSFNSVRLIKGKIGSIYLLFLIYLFYI